MQRKPGWASLASIEAGGWWRLWPRLLLSVVALNVSVPLGATPDLPTRGWPSEELALPFAEPSVHAATWDAQRELLWVGTPNEVGVFDGHSVRWSAVAAPDVLIPRSMVAVPEGLLVGTINGTLWLFDGNLWKTILDIGGQSTFWLAKDAHGGVWIANSFSWPDSRLRYYRDGKLRDVETGERLVEASAARMDSEGRLWLILFGAVHAFKVEDGRLVDQVSVPTAPEHLRPLALEIAPDNTVLVGHEKGAMALTPQGWKPLPLDEIGLGAVLALKVDGAGRVWVAGEKGLAFSDGGAFFRVDVPRVISSVGWPPALEIDGYGQLWVGSSAGLWRVRLDVEHRSLPGTFTRLSAAAGWLWAAGEPGLVRIDPTTGALSWAVEGGHLVAVAAAPDRENLWGLLRAQGTEPGGLFKANGAGLVRVGPLPPGIDDGTRLRVAPNGRLWVAHRWGYGLWTWDGTRWTASVIDAPQFEGGTAVAALEFDADGRLWAVLPDRIACFDGNRWVASGVIVARRPVKINGHGSALPNRDGGMTVYGPWRHLVRAQLVSGSIVVDALSEDGLVGRIPEDWPEFAPDGRAFWLASGGRLFRWADGRFWTVDPALEPWFPEIQSPLVVDGRLWALSRFEDPERTGPTTLVSLPWATAPTPRLSSDGSAPEAVVQRPFFDVRYAGRSWWWKPENLVYRVRTQPEVQGREEWTRDPRATFSDQPHGQRREIEVQAFDPLGHASAPLRFTRTIRLPLAERPWFVPAMVAVAVVVTIPLTAGLLLILRRFRAHGYRTLEITLGDEQRDRFELLRGEIIALGPRPPLSSLREIGLQLGKTLPDELWRAQVSRFRRDRRLRLVARTPEDEWMLALPWEAAGGDATTHFLGQLPNVTILRCGVAQRDPEPRPRRPRFLHLVASPEGHGPLAASEEAAALPHSLPAFEFLAHDSGRRLTREALAATLAATPADVLHLSCHGRRSANGFEFLLEDEDGEAAPLPGHSFVELLRGVDRGGEGRPPFRLVALNVCEALGVPAPETTRALGSVLLEAGADGVVGYFFELGSVSAEIFWKTFYATWWRHGQTDHAAQRARAAVRALRNPALHDFAAVGVFTADAGGRVCPP